MQDQFTFDNYILTGGRKAAKCADTLQALHSVYSKYLNKSTADQMSMSSEIMANKPEWKEIGQKIEKEFEIEVQKLTRKLNDVKKTSPKSDEVKDLEKQLKKYKSRKKEFMEAKLLGEMMKSPEEMKKLTKAIAEIDLEEEKNRQKQMDYITDLKYEIIELFAEIKGVSSEEVEKMSINTVNFIISEIAKEKENGFDKTAADFFTNILSLSN